MKVLIAYCSKTGTAAACADRLRRELHRCEVVLADLASSVPNPEEFDLIILGSSIRFGKVGKAFSSYVRLHHSKLLEKPLGLFLCCGIAEETERYFENMVDAELRDHAFAVLTFGGDLKPRNAGWFDRLVLRLFRDKIRESEIEDGEFTPTLPAVLPENIGKMASYIRSEAEKL